MTQEINLRQISFPVTSVNGYTIIRLQWFGNDREAWNYPYQYHQDILPVSQAIRNLVKKTRFVQSKFDFSQIESIAASKSFSINYNPKNISKYDNALEWGLNMYESDNIAFSTDEDFQRNIDHLRREGIGQNGRIYIDIYGWLNDRVLWANAGGSHHAAALIRQMHEQGRKFYCEAIVSKYELNLLELKALSKKFHFLVADDRCVLRGMNTKLGYELSKSNINMASVKMPVPVQDLDLLVIPKFQRGVDESHLDGWIRQSIEKKTMIDFIHFLENPSIYLTNNRV